MQIICSILKKIYAGNLLFFSCIGCLTFEFVLVNLTSIVEAYIDFTGGFPSNHLYTAAHEIKLLSGLHRVKSLSLTIDALEVCIIYHLHYFNILAFNYVFFSIQTTFFLGITIMNRFFFFPLIVSSIHKILNISFLASAIWRCSMWIGELPISVKKKLKSSRWRFC
jgi:hypothetical protein